MKLSTHIFIISVFAIINISKAKAIDIPVGGDKVVGEAVLSSILSDTILINGVPALSFMKAHSILAVCGAGSYTGIYAHPDIISGGFRKEIDTSWAASTAYPSYDLSLDTMPGNGYTIVTPTNGGTNKYMGYPVLQNSPNGCSVGSVDLIIDGYNRVMFFRIDSLFAKIQMYGYTSTEVSVRPLERFLRRMSG